MSSLFGQVWFWSLLAFLVGAVLTWVLLVRPAQQRVQQLERQPRGGRPTPASGHAQPQQIPPHPQQGPLQPPPPRPAWPEPPPQEPGDGEHHPRTQWLERDSLPEMQRGHAPERPDQMPEQPGQAPEQRDYAPEQPSPAPEQHGQIPDQREFVPAEPPAPYSQQEELRRELEREFPEEFERDYQEDYDRDYAEDAQDYAPEYGYGQEYAEPEEHTGRVHPTSHADNQPYDQSPFDQQAYNQRSADWSGTTPAPGAAASAAAGAHGAAEQDDMAAPTRAWYEQPPSDLPGTRDRLDDIDEQPDLGGLADLDSGSDVDQREALVQRPGGLFEPTGSAEPDTAHAHDGYEAPGYDTDGYQADNYEAGGYQDADAQPAPPGTAGVAAPEVGGDLEDESGAPDTDPVTGLPRRRRGASNRIRGGFAPPRPIEPSIRPVTRRTPQQEGGSSSGSLFEPSQGEQSAGAVAQAGGQGEAAGIPPGPFGPGSAMPLPGGGRPDPSFTVKASVTELRYCTEGSPQFASMIPEVWFATPGDAERVGFRPLQ